MILSKEFLKAWEEAEDQEMIDYLAGGQTAMNGDPVPEEESEAFKKGHEAGK